MACWQCVTIVEHMFHCDESTDLCLFNCLPFESFIDTHQLLDMWILLQYQFTPGRVGLIGVAIGELSPRNT